jgi:hypothetical protein
VDGDAGLLLDPIDVLARCAEHRPDQLRRSDSYLAPRVKPERRRGLFGVARGARCHRAARLWRRNARLGLQQQLLLLRHDVR